MTALLSFNPNALVCLLPTLFMAGVVLLAQWRSR